MGVEKGLVLFDNIILGLHLRVFFFFFFFGGGGGANEVDPLQEMVHALIGVNSKARDFRIMTDRYTLEPTQVNPFRGDQVPSNNMISSTTDDIMLGPDRVKSF